MVDNVWKEAMGKLKEYLDVPVASILPGQVCVDKCTEWKIVTSWQIERGGGGSSVYPQPLPMTK